MNSELRVFVLMSVALGVLTLLFLVLAVMLSTRAWRIAETTTYRCMVTQAEIYAKKPKDLNATDRECIEMYQRQAELINTK